MNTLNLNARWNSALANALDYSDLNKLWQHLLDALADYVDVTSLSVIHYKKGTAPKALFSVGNDDPVDNRVDAYIKGAYLLDPFYRNIIYEKATGLCTLNEIAPPDFEDSQYYKTFFSAYGLYDEINILNWIDENSAIALSLGRRMGERRFGLGSMSRLKEIESLLSTVAMKTWENLSDSTSEEDSSEATVFHHRLQVALEKFGTSVLTPREKDVLDHLLRGYSVKSAAEQMGVSAGTVRIHRHSIYEKLDIGSQTELFALILECLRQTTDDIEVDPLKRMMPPDF